MRKLFAASIMIGFLCSVALAQNVEPGRQSGAAGQKQGEPAGQGDTVRGQIPGQTPQGQAAQGQINQGQQTFQQGQTRQSGQTAPGQAGQQFAPRQEGQQGQGRDSQSDQEIAACVYGACHNEIEIAKLGEQKAQNKEVRDFAQKMIREHTPGCQEMQRRAGNLASETPTQPRQGGNLDWISIHKQIGQQCLATVKQELSQKQSAEFDHCFMGLQIAEHLAVVDKLKVLRNYASQDLQQVLDKELHAAQQHLQLAKQIEEGLKGSPSERVSRKPDGSNK